MLLCHNKSSTEFMLSASDKRRYIKRLIFLVSVAEQAGLNRGLNTTLGLSETPKTELALHPIKTFEKSTFTCLFGNKTVHRQDNSPTRILKTVHRQI